MNRKLHHSMLALTSTAAVFTLLLLAGAPAGVPPADRGGLSAEDALIDGATFIVDPAADASQRRHLRHSRAVLALPYFSFAQGLRRNRS